MKRALTTPSSTELFFARRPPACHTDGRIYPGFSHCRKKTSTRTRAIAKVLASDLQPDGRCLHPTLAGPYPNVATRPFVLAWYRRALSQPYKALAKTTPPGPKTGKVVPKCYAGALSDCDGELTREHWISEAVLLEVSVDGETFITNAAGMPRAGRWVPTSSYAAKVLCHRHNQALSPLDAEAHRFMQVLEDVGKASTGGAASPAYVFSGHDLERWMLKALCGAMASGAFQTRRAERLRGEVPKHWLEQLFHLPYMPKGWGLSFSHHVGRAFSIDKNVGLAPLLIAGEVVGITASLRGFDFALVLRDVPLEHRGGSLSPADVYRPAAFRIIYGESRDTFVRFCWDVAPLNSTTISVLWQPGRTVNT
ncbi:MAG TPA: hypothetical protein VK550_10945 [Polyangiaceae bacterium]|nr:hypothetical protein [Polyangiaceae bacterium]